MPEIRYRSVLSLEAVDFVVALPKRGQKRVLEFADQIAKHPFKIGDYQTLDGANRRVNNLLLEDYHFSFWVDHASREVRITEIVRV